MTDSKTSQAEAFDVGDEWTDQDIRDMTAFSLKHAEASVETDDHIVARASSASSPCERSSRVGKRNGKGHLTLRLTEIPLRPI